MMRAFLQREGWFFDGEHWRKDLVYHGDVFAVCPGIPNRWDHHIETYLKKIAYTSEKGIDWWSQHVAVIGKGVSRGAIYTMDPWLFERCILGVRTS